LAGAALIDDFNQAMFCVIAEVLCASASATLLDQPAKPVIAVSLVLIGEQLVINDQPGTCGWTIE